MKFFSLSFSREFFVKFVVFDKYIEFSKSKFTVFLAIQASRLKEEEETVKYECTSNGFKSFGIQKV